jgi:hypothetical protein
MSKLHGTEGGDVAAPPVREGCAPLSSRLHRRRMVRTFQNVFERLGVKPRYCVRGDSEGGNGHCPRWLHRRLLTLGPDPNAVQRAWELRHSAPLRGGGVVGLCAPAARAPTRRSPQTRHTTHTTAPTAHRPRSHERGYTALAGEWLWWFVETSWKRRPATPCHTTMANAHPDVTG